MSGFTLTISTDNAAFHVEEVDDEDGYYAPHWEVARLLREVADKIGVGHDRGPIIDVNGNTVGGFAFTGDEP